MKDRLRLVSQIKKQMSHGGSMDSCSLNFKASSSVMNALEEQNAKKIAALATGRLSVVGLPADPVTIVPDGCHSWSSLLV